MKGRISRVVGFTKRNIYSPPIGSQYVYTENCGCHYLTTDSIEVHMVLDKFMKIVITILSLEFLALIPYRARGQIVDHSQCTKGHSDIGIGRFGNRFSLMSFSIIKKQASIINA